MEQQIINYLTRSTYEQFEYIKISDNILDIVYHLLINNKDLIKEEIIIQNPTLCYYYGIYHQVRHNGKLLKRYYKKATEYGISEAMDELGYYYCEHNKLNKMKTYYLMAIEKGNKSAMYHLGCYYCSINDYESMINYFMMAINYGDIKSMYAMGTYYEMINNYELMKKIEPPLHYYFTK